MFGISGPIFVLTAIGVLPIALLEFSLGVWLTVKGFNPSAITSEQTATDELLNAASASAHVETAERRQLAKIISWKHAHMTIDVCTMNVNSEPYRLHSFLKEGF